MIIILLIMTSSVTYHLMFFKNDLRPNHVPTTVAEDILENEKAGEEEQEKAGQHN